MTYKACISYENSRGYKYTCECSGFEDVEDATMWVGEQFTHLMLNRGEIDEEGIVVHAEVCDENGGFSDIYTLHCGC